MKPVANKLFTLCACCFDQKLLRSHFYACEVKMCQKTQLQPKVIQTVQQHFRIYFSGEV